MMKRLLIYFAAAVFALVAVTLTSKQPARTGSVRGTVTDPSGGVVPGAAVTLMGTGGSNTILTDTSGKYQLAGLTPGHYSVVVRAQGFQRFEDPSLVVAPGQISEADAPLALGQASQAITVTASQAR